MKLYIGGSHQGKTGYVSRETGITPVRCTPEQALTAKAINCFHLTVRDLLTAGGNPAAFTQRLVRENPDALVISDEIGLGIVPLDPFERQWREETGRALCQIAGAAESVVRISCGLGLRLK